LKNAEENDFIRGVVGWVDLQGKDIEERLVYYSSFKKDERFQTCVAGGNRQIANAEA
jgi:L-fuconolactonase